MSNYRIYNDGSIEWLQYKSKFLCFTKWKYIRTTKLYFEVIGSGIGDKELFINSKNTDIKKFINNFPTFKDYKIFWGEVIKMKMIRRNEREKLEHENFNRNKGVIKYL